MPENIKDDTETNLKMTTEIEITDPVEILNLQRDLIKIPDMDIEDTE